MASSLQPWPPACHPEPLALHPGPLFPRASHNKRASPIRCPESTASTLFFLNSFGSIGGLEVIPERKPLTRRNAIFAVRDFCGARETNFPDDLPPPIVGARASPEPLRARAPEHARNAPETRPKRARTRPHAARTPQNAPETRQNASERAQDAPELSKNAPECPKDAPEQPRTSPERPQNSSERP